VLLLLSFVLSFRWDPSPTPPPRGEGLLCVRGYDHTSNHHPALSPASAAAVLVGRLQRVGFPAHAKNLRPRQGRRHTRRSAVPPMLTGSRQPTLWDMGRESSDILLPGNGGVPGADYWRESLSRSERNSRSHSPPACVPAFHQVPVRWTPRGRLLVPIIVVARCDVAAW
jgi:hypothetical protein